LSSGTCDGGYCTAGVCQPLLDFNYPPSNFLPAQVSSWSPPVRIQVGCDPSFDSTAGRFAQTCTQTLPTPQLVTLADARTAYLLAFAGLTIDTGATFSLHGDRPVILAVRGNVDVRGTIDASSRNNFGITADVVGPGASWAGCGTGSGGNGTFASNRGGGGGGGAFASVGAAGGNVNGSVGAGAAGVVNGTPTLIPLRGGCSGGAGADNGGPQTNGGMGGGAVQISAAGTLTLSGVVHACGSGGGGSTVDNGGGGGGGSGGAILLEGGAVSIAMSSLLLTNGGGGGEGSGAGIARVGFQGANGSRIDLKPAVGGSGNLEGGNGGDGAAGRVGIGAFSAAGVGLTGTQGAGAGGGGVGRIRVNAADGGCTIGAAIFSGDVSKSASCP
jgi:hypothetical protein